MASNLGDLETCVVELLENDVQTYQKARKTLLRIMENIERNRGIEKYRRIKMSSAVVTEDLLPANGALACLLEAGFVEDNTGDYLILPMETALLTLKRIYKQIQSYERPLVGVSKSTTGNVDSNSQSSKSGQPKLEETSQPLAKKWPKWKFPVLPSNVAMLELQFYSKMKNSFDHVLVYEDRALQQKAIQCIPKDRLTQNATQKFSAAKDSTFKLADFYIIELMDWFRDDFFQWVSAPDCEHCAGKTQHIGMGEPSQDDRRWGAGRVELYRCTQCNRTTRFPRYNHPGKLLDTKRGRCGEWANCFTLICRASGYEARYVLDSTDHVWTEVYSQSQQRWLHCDPGEKALDKPLLYETGWGKKLTYIIGFTKDDINDVTWRYSADHQALILRRKECRESWLIKAIKALRDERQLGMSDLVKRVHQLRLIKEGAEFISSKRKTHSAGEMIGRLTGSVEWRDARGEMGVAATPHFTFSPGDEDLKNGCMDVTYSSATNYYTQSGVTEPIYDWRSCVYENKSVERTVEVDWNMTYLARAKQSASASISWNFDLASSSKTIHQVNISVSSTTFHSGCIVWTLKDNHGNTTIVQPNAPYTVQSFKGATSLTLCAELSSGNGEDAWQHTQLFRQKRDSTQPMMSVKIQFA